MKRHMLKVPKEMFAKPWWKYTAVKILREIGERKVSIGYVEMFSDLRTLLSAVVHWMPTRAWAANDRAGRFSSAVEWEWSNGIWNFTCDYENISGHWRRRASANMSALDWFIEIDKTETKTAVKRLVMRICQSEKCKYDKKRWLTNWGW